MRMPVTLLVAIGEAALNVAGVGLVGDAAEIGKAAWNLWKKSPEERLDELEAVVQADDKEIEQAAQRVATEVAGDQPEEVRIRVGAFLTQVPSRIRQSQRRPADPTGRTIRPGLVMCRLEDLIPFVPDQLPQFQPGNQPLAGVDWVLVELLGMGGFGEAWKARHAHFDSFNPVALKFCTDPVARQRLLRHEAKVLDRVMRQGRHPGIVRLEATYLSADPPCLQYECIQGGDLGGWIEDGHRQAEKPSADRVARAMLELAEIVAFAHRLDPPIVHRDLKSANILVQQSRSGETAFKITDFGIGGIATARAIQASRVPTSPSEFLTTAVRGSGTFLYASPEQLRGNDPDPRDDVHALGVIWYQMLIGDLTKGRPGGTAWRRRFLERGMSAGLVELLESCFYDQEDRPADAAVLVERLGNLLRPAGGEKKKEKAPDPVPAGEIVNSIGMKLKLIPAGEFQMGSTESDDEKPRHLVTITRPFYLGAYPATQREYMQVAKKNPSHFSGNECLPVESVSWLEAVAFCNALSQKEGLHRSTKSMAGQCRFLTGMDRATGCRPRRNGNTPAGRGPRRGFRSVTTRIRWVNLPGLPRIPAVRRILSVRRSRTPSACTTCTATCWNGAGTRMMRATTRGRRRKIRGGLMRPPPGCSGAGAGATSRSSRGPRTGAGPCRSTGPATWASAWPEFKEMIELRSGAR